MTHLPDFCVGVRFGLGDYEFVFDEKNGAGPFIFTNVEFVFLLEILGDVDWFLWELEFTAGIWDDEPILLIVEIV